MYKTVSWATFLIISRPALIYVTLFPSAEQKSGLLSAFPGVSAWQVPIFPKNIHKQDYLEAMDKGNLFTLSVLAATAEILNRYLNFED